MKIKNVTLTSNEYARDNENNLYKGVDFEDVAGLLILIDNLLKPFDLELYVGQAKNKNNVWLTIKAK